MSYISNIVTIDNITTKAESAVLCDINVQGGRGGPHLEPPSFDRNFHNLSMLCNAALAPVGRLSLVEVSRAAIELRKVESFKRTKPDAQASIFDHTVLIRKLLEIPPAL